MNQFIHIHSLKQIFLNDCHLTNVFVGVRHNSDKLVKSLSSKSLHSRDKPINKLLQNIDLQGGKCQEEKQFRGD